MQGSETLFWLQQGEERLRTLLAMQQPMTADQLAGRLEKQRSSVSEHIRQMRVYRVLKCLNPESHQSRLYWLTEEGVECRSQLASLYKNTQPGALPLSLDWQVYGELCFRHRRAVLLAMHGRMRPPQVKKRAFARDARLRMSVDNCREVLYWMVSRGVVRGVRPRGKRFVLYELTEVGKTCQELLRKAVTPTAG